MRTVQMWTIAMKERASHDVTPSPEYFADFASSYNDAVDESLRLLMLAGAKDLLQVFTDSFYTQLGKRADSSLFLSRLSPAEFDQLKSNQTQHLELLLAPGLTPQAHYERALYVGWVHEMVSLGLPVLLEAYHLYHSKIDEILTSTLVDLPHRETLRMALHQRLQLDVEAQIASHVRMDGEVVSLMAALDAEIQKSGNLADMLRSSLQVLGDFDGISACLFSRPDANGIMQIEAEGGEQGQKYAEALRSQRVPLFEIQEATNAGNGPAGRAWRTGEIQVNDSFFQEGTLRPWRAEAAQRGFRSSAAVPLSDEFRHTFAVLSVYSPWPGYFSSLTRTAMLRHIQQILSRAVLHCEQTQVIPADLRRNYRRYLDEGSVEMFYQPIIDLRTGKLESVEALARMRRDDGQLVMPAAFLPAFGDAGLLRLFQLGLEQVCRNSRMWLEEDTNLSLPVSLNLPPDGLAQNAYRDCVFETLSRWQLPPSILSLEMLETKESFDISKRDARVAEFQQAGIRIVQDDLGSGHSSLLRMDRIPCDRVKIDQGLVRGTLKRPVRALEFIHHLTLLAQGFGSPVTVEGLEDEGLIEAAAILGADHGQGYGIAKPMPAQNVMEWSRAWVFPIDPEQPRTALGALAGYLLWDYKLGTLTDWPELAATFIKEPWLVHRYLASGNGLDPELPAMLERTQILALQGQRSAKYVGMRKELIERLGEIWLETRV